jgi:hypothetical protein
VTSGARSYLIINIILAGVVIVILFYSVLFSPEKNNYPVQCVHERVSGIPCPSCGLSHSLSYIVRGDFNSAQLWNRYGIRVFLFFVFQLIARASISTSIIKSGKAPRSLIGFDLVITILSFILGFSQFVIYNFSLLNYSNL